MASPGFCHWRKNAWSRKAGGFSLVELLVVVAVLAVIITLAGVSFGKAREQAAAAECASRLRTVGVGLNGYIMEKGYYPGVRIDPTPRSWYHGLYPYIEQRPVPATAAERAVVPDWVYCKIRKPGGLRTVGFGYNQMFGNIPPGASDYSDTSPFNKYWHLRPALVEEPGSKIVIGENHDGDVETGFAVAVLHNGNSVDNYLRARRHMGGGNYLFADGHVELIGAAEMARRLSIDNKRILRPYD